MCTLGEGLVYLRRMGFSNFEINTRGHVTNIFAHLLFWQAPEEKLGANHLLRVALRVRRERRSGHSAALSQVEGSRI